MRGDARKVWLVGCVICDEMVKRWLKIQYICIKKICGQLGSEMQSGKRQNKSLRWINKAIQLPTIQCLQKVAQKTQCDWIFL